LRFLIAAAAACALSCKAAPPAPSGSPGDPLKITITATGVSPKNIEVPVGSRVLFINNDVRTHYMHSDPHPDQTDCPELNQVGVLAPSQRRETGNLVAPRVCGYHDHNLFTDPTLQGTITIR
jgi:hypothetical protein